MKPDFTKLNYEYDSGLLTSEEVYIPPIKQGAEIWINTEVDNSGKCSKKQLSVLNDFIEISSEELANIQVGLKEYSKELLTEKGITEESLLNPDSYDLKYTALIIPQQDKTVDKYVLILADTNWQITDSEYTLEIEILIKNNHFDFLQEYSGLWTRLEWNSYYNVRSI